MLVGSDRAVICRAWIPTRPWPYPYKLEAGQRARQSVHLKPETRRHNAPHFSSPTATWESVALTTTISSLSKDFSCCQNFKLSHGLRDNAKTIPSGSTTLIMRSSDVLHLHVLPEDDLLQAVPNPDSVLKFAFATQDCINSQDCINYLHSCGYPEVIYSAKLQTMSVISTYQTFVNSIYTSINTLSTSPC